MRDNITYNSNGYNALVNHGLTNAGLDSAWSTGTRAQHTTYALCCGESHTNTNKDQCFKCRQYLKWENRVTSIATIRIQAYVEKHNKIREAHVQKERQSRIG